MPKKKSQASSKANAKDNESPGTAVTAPPSSSGPATPDLPSPHSPMQGFEVVKLNEKTKALQLSTSALIICRNKHWRYISSFHGPWLQLPPDILETLSYSNYASPRPHPVDPGVFFDLVKIRRAIDEATDLAVRAANGTTSSALGNSLNASNGMLGGGGSAMLGLGLGGGSGHAKLSRERRHRMREHATQKLAKAYRLDEIAASVATMQSASALEEVAKLVLQRNQSDCDAKYVHFFHEKIPSRTLAECTTLEPLDDIISARPREPATYRTRAATRVFKDDFAGAARDLTEGYTVYRLYSTPHAEAENDGSVAKKENETQKDIREELRVDEKDQPTGIEAQFFFNRGGVYLSLACQYIDSALDDYQTYQQELAAATAATGGEGENAPTLSTAGKEAYRRWLESRKLVKTNARRALRDYMSFLSKFDYTPGLSSEVAEAFLRRVNYTASGNFGKPRRPKKPGRDSGDGSPDDDGEYTLPTTIVYKVSDLFSAQAPADLPPFPAEPSEEVVRRPSTPDDNERTSHEAVTYHPLLTDALHSLLLCHAVVQTSTKELLRHAFMAARVARVCDGYPIFLAPRSPSRADWIEVVNNVNNWLDLGQTWESLCTPAPLDPGRGVDKLEVAERENLKREALLEALNDDRVFDEASFRAAVRVRERKAELQKQELQGKTRPKPTPTASAENAPTIPLIKRWAQEDGKEYPICTERAENIVRWIQESPLTTGEGRGKGKKGKKKKSAKNAGQPADAEEAEEGEAKAADEGPDDAE